MMTINWKAVAYGFIVSLIIGIVNGLVVVGTGMVLPIIGWGLAGIIAGLVAGYVGGGTRTDGAVNGGLSTIIGSLVLLFAVTFSNILFAGLVPAVGAFTFWILVLLIYAIPGMIGGAIGSWSKERQVMRGTTGPAA